jgi:hypothetical protein
MPISGNWRFLRFLPRFWGNLTLFCFRCVRIGGRDASNWCVLAQREYLFTRDLRGGHLNAMQKNFGEWAIWSEICCQIVICTTIIPRSLICVVNLSGFICEFGHTIRGDDAGRQAERVFESNSD